MFSRAAALQGAGVAVVAFLATVVLSPAEMLAFLYGGAVSLVNTWLLRWRHGRGEHDHHGDTGRHLKAFYRSSLERFVVVGVCLAVGLALSEPTALPMLLGFVVGQLAWMAAAVSMR